MKRYGLLILLSLIVSLGFSQVLTINGDVKTCCLTPNMDTIVTIEKFQGDLYIKKRCVTQPTPSRLVGRLNINDFADFGAFSMVSPNGRYFTFIKYHEMYPYKLYVYDFHVNRIIKDIYLPNIFKKGLGDKMVFNDINFRFNLSSTELYFGTIGRTYGFNLDTKKIRKVRFENEYGTLNDYGFHTYDYILDKPILNDLKFSGVEGTVITVNNLYIGDNKSIVKNRKKFDWQYKTKDGRKPYHHYSKYYIGIELLDFWDIGTYSDKGYLSVIDKEYYLISVGRKGSLYIQNVTKSQ